MAAAHIVLTGPRRYGVWPNPGRDGAPFGSGRGVSHAAVRMRSIWQLRAESRRESRQILRESR